MSEFRLCLRSLGGVSWMGAMLYTQNLTKAVTMHAAEVGIDLTIHTPVRFVDKARLKLCKELADRVRVIPTSLLNPGKFDFVYPDLAGARAPYRWGSWIPDLQERYLPDLFFDKDIEWRSKIYRQSADAAPVVVLSSEMARNDFLNLYPKAESKSFILNFTSCPDPEWTAGDPIAIQAKYGLPDRFFLVSNQFWKHKDHGVIIDALAILRERGVTPTVACTGWQSDYRDPDYFPKLQEKIASLGLTEQMPILGLIPRVEQIQLMRRCLAVVQPSRFEGWSTVVEDARALGKPILLSDFPVHREQNPPMARFFACGNAEELAEVMADAFAQLSPGPDIAVETRAVQNAVDKTRDCGKRFLDIARSA